MASTADFFAFAVRQFQAGNHRLVEEICRQILQADPGHAGSHQLLGDLAYKTSRLAEAAEHYQASLRLSPNNAGAYNNLGACLTELGRLDDALACYGSALQLNPNFAEAHNGKGYALQRKGNSEKAILSYRQALLLKPAFAEALYNLGNALSDAGQMVDAIDAYREALRIRPNYAHAWLNLGNAFARQEKLDDATRCYREASRLDPHSAEAQYNLGLVLKRQGSLQDAINCFQAVVRANSNAVQAYCDLAMTLRELGQLEEAEVAFRHALRLQPEFAKAHNGLGNVLLDLGKPAAALECHRHALRLKPDDLDFLCDLAHVLQHDLQYEEALTCYERARALGMDRARPHIDLGHLWMKMGRADQALSEFRHALSLEPNNSLAQTNVLFCLNYDPNLSAADIFGEHRRWGQLQEAALAGISKAALTDPNPTRRLRIGYVSPDFRNHVLTRYFEPVLAHHDPKEVEVFCYAEVSHADAVTARLQRLAHAWRWTIRVPDIKVAEQIRNDRIDILVDLAGHTANNRLGVFAHKPAPVQATWLGYLNTTGLNAIDYRLTDDVLDPPGQPRHDTEELVRLPLGFCCFATPEDAPLVAPLPALPKGYLTFGSMHNLFKLNLAVFDLWCRVLKAVPTARMLVFRDTLKGLARERIGKEFTNRGIAAERLDLRSDVGPVGHLGVYKQIDVNLDAFPFTGGVTTCESLWMGVPVLSLRGNRPAGRNSSAILTRVGLSNWAVDSPDQFVEKAVKLQEALEDLASLRSQLRQKMQESLCDAARFTKGLEEAYRSMWQRWCAKHAGA